MKRWPTKPIGEFVEERTERLSQGSATIYSVTNDNGFVRSLYLFDKRVFSADTSNYKCVAFLDLAYNPSRINVGSVALCVDKDGGAVSPMYCIVRCKPGLHPRYLLHFLKSEVGLHQVRQRCEGAVRFQLKFRDLCAIPIIISPLAEQERIVKLLDEADELQKLRAQADRRTAALIPSLFHEMFGDPVSNPFCWPMKRAGDLMAACEYGTSHKANEEGLGIPVLRMGNVTTDGLLDLTDLKTVELEDSELGKQRLQAGDVLFNRTNSRELVGKTGMWDGRFDAVPASYFIRARFRPDAEHPQHFTAFMNLPFMKRRLAEMARGAVGQANINSKELQSIELPLPPLSLQKEFAQRVAEIRGLEAQQAASRRCLEALFQSMLHRAFRGGL